MIAECNVKIGGKENHIIIPNNMVLACSFVESIFNLPNGRLIVKISSLGLDEIYNLPSNIPIEIMISTYEKPDASDISDETTKTFKGTIVKHYTKNDEEFTDKTVYVIEFISIGNNLSYVAQLKPQAIVNSSVGTIQELSKISNIPLEVTSKDIMTNDVMKWLVCKKNFITAVESILNHSYLDNEDALYFTYLANGTTKIGSIKNEFNNPKNITFIYSKNKIDIVNKTIPLKNTNVLVYFKNEISRSSAITSTIGNSAVTMAKPMSGNKVSSSQVGVGQDKVSIPKITGLNESTEKKNGLVGGVVANNETVNTKNSNTHNHYGIAPIIRNNVYARYSNKITLSAPAENIVSIGDVVNVAVPTVATTAIDSDKTSYSKALSGKYMVVSKTYSFGGINTFQFITSIDLITDSINSTVDSKTMFSNIGVKDEDVK